MLYCAVPESNLIRFNVECHFNSSAEMSVLIFPSFLYLNGC